MDNMSFSDEQLLNLVNNTIKTKSDFKLEDFTGGGVQITSTHNHKIIKYKIYLTFGYDNKRNSRSYSEDISDDISFIWQKAIALKVKSMQALNVGSSLSDLNKLMNTDIKIEIEDIKIEDRDKECNDIVPTSLRTPSVSQKRFKVPSIQEIQSYIQEKGYFVDVDTFFNFYESNGWKVGKNKMKSWKASLATWHSKNKSENQHKSFKQQDSERINNSVDAYFEAVDNGFSLRQQLSGTIEGEVINELK